MNNFTDSTHIPTPLASEDELQSLDDLDSVGGGHDAKPFSVFIGHNMGFRTFTMVLPIKEFFENSSVANDTEEGPVAQRPLDKTHAKKLAKYALQGLIHAAMEKRRIQSKDIIPAFAEILDMLGRQVYYSSQPLVCNLRDCGPGGKKIRGSRNTTASGETASFKIWLSPRDILWVIDGQHRKEGLKTTFEFLETVQKIVRRPHSEHVYPKGPDMLIESLKGQPISNDQAIVLGEALNAARGFATVSIELHLGLNIEQERQLFHDMNNLGKKPNSSLSLNYDSANPINQFLSNFLVDNLNVKIVDDEIKNWDEDEGSFSRKELVAVNARAFLNKGNASGMTPADFQEKEACVKQMWSAITSCENFGQLGAKRLTVLHQSVVLKAIAKICFDMNFNKRKPSNGDVLYATFLDKLGSIDFSHSNPMWRYYEFTDPERHLNNLGGLDSFLPPFDPDVNRDVGMYQGSLMRFGSKHNDIFPLISDMLRWKTGLPSRRS